MKKTISIFAILFSINASCQSTLVQYLQYRSDDTGKNKCELAITDTVSLWLDKQSKIADEPYFIYKSIKEKKLFQNNSVFSKKYFVTDSLCNFSWTLTEETTTILNQKCLSATTHFRGRDYVAFYAPALVYNDGPWKFCGLPGLILSVKSKDNYLSIVASELTLNSKNNLNVAEKLNNKYINWQQFEKEFIEKMDKLILKAKSSVSKDDTGSSYKFKLEAIEIIYPKVQTGEGIEF